MFFMLFKFSIHAAQGNILLIQDFYFSEKNKAQIYFFYNNLSEF